MNLSVAIVGAGWMGETHARAVVASGDIVALVIDADLSRAQSLAAQFGSASDTRLEAAKEMDAAIIATPSAMHLDQSETLAGLGLHVLVEKPHRFPNQNASRLAEIVGRSGNIFQVGMTTRFHPGLREIAGAVHEGVLGDILSYTDRYWFKLDDDTLPPWYFDPVHAGGGVLLTNGVHILDRCRWMLGEALDIRHVKTARLFESHHIEDFASVSGAGAVSDCAVHLSLLWSPAEPGPSELAIVGTKGVARSTGQGWSIETADGSRSGPAPEPDEPFTLQWRDFRSKCLGHSKMQPGDPDLGMLELTLDQIDQITKSGD